MSSVTLHSFRRCPFAIRARTVLEEKEIPHCIIEENLSDFSKELLELHPEGRVPLLIHQKSDQRVVIYQSSIITEYLDEAFPGNRLMPEDPVGRAQVRLWTYWCDQIFKPDLDLYKYGFSKLNADEKTAVQTRLQHLLAHWNAALQSQAYLLGDRMTLADIHLFPFARQFLAIKPPFPRVDDYSYLKEWLGNMISRPAFERVMASK